MRRTVQLGVLCALGALVVGCGSDDTGARAEPGDPVATAGAVRFSLPTPHQVVAERRTADGWGDPRVVFEDDGRECGRVDAVAAGSAVAATVSCDEHFAEDQAPTRSVALISSDDGRTWTHRDLDGEAYQAPGISPEGGHAVWVQGEDLLTWADGTFGSAPPPPGGSPQVVTVDDDGTVLGVGVGTLGGPLRGRDPRRGHTGAAGRGPGGRDAGAAVRRARARADLPVGAGRATCPARPAPRSSYAGTAERRVGPRGPDRRSPHRAWTSIPTTPSRAVWNQLTVNAGGDLVAVGSPDRRHVTAQRYDRAQQRWTPSRVVHVAAGPTCRRRVDDSGLLQGATFRLRLFCDGRPVVALQPHRGGLDDLGLSPLPCPRSASRRSAP